MKYIYLLLILGLTNIEGNSLMAEENKLKEKAMELSRKFLIIDTHIDLPLHLLRGWQDISDRNSYGEMNYPKAKEGGLDAAFMSIYIPPRLQGTKEAELFANNLIEKVETLINENPDKFSRAVSTEDVINNFKNHIISLPMGMENGAPVTDFELLKYYYEKGIRYITLAHGKANHICDSSYDEDKKWKGLSPFGKELIKEMNRIGMIIDVSHISDDAFYQVMEISGAPVIASHSSCRNFTPGFERNMSDDMLKALAKNGGVIQINFGSDFLNQSYKQRKKDYEINLKYFREKNNLSDDDPRLKEFRDKYLKENPIGYAEVKDVADHIDHVVKLIGVDFVGLGSDFDGVGDTLPTGLKDVSMYPNLIHELLTRGFSEEDIQKICSGNLLRVWKQIEDHASNR